MEDKQTTDLKTEALKYGLILGIVTILITLLGYIADVGLLVNWKFSLSALIAVVALAVYFVNKYRNEETGGFLEFKKAYLMAFIILLIANFVSASFQILLYNVIDPEVAEIVIDQTLENTEIMMRNFGADDEKIDEALDNMAVEMPNNFSPLGILKNSWAYALSAAFFGLIVAAITKRSKPDFDY